MLWTAGSLENAHRNSDATVGDIHGNSTAVKTIPAGSRPAETTPLNCGRITDITGIAQHQSQCGVS
jgi:hypothetical protein